MILLLDHADSFVHVLAGYIAEIGGLPVVRRIDSITLDQIREMAPSRIILSPGPGHPEHYPLSLDLIRTLDPATPLLGVCLGHQCIGAAFGATVRRAAAPRHGMTSAIRHDGGGIFSGLPSPFLATRYHSLAVRAETLPADLVATAWADDSELMGLRHRERPIEGVQFHPESILTEHGKAMIKTFLES